MARGPAIGAAPAQASAAAGRGAVGDGGPVTQQGRLIVVTQAPVNSRLALPAADSLFVPDTTNEIEILRDGGGLNYHATTYTDPTLPSSQIVPGPAPGVNAIRGAGAASAQGNARWPLDGILAKDEFSLRTGYMSRGADITAQSWWAAGADTVFILTGGGAMYTQTIELRFQSGILRVIVTITDKITGATHQAVDQAASLTYRQITVASGDFPADTFVPIDLSFDQSSGMLLQYAAKNSGAAGIPSYSFREWSAGPVGAGVGIQLGTSGPRPGDQNGDRIPPSTRRYSQNPARFTGGLARKLAGPKVTIDPSSPGRSFPRDLGGVVSFPSLAVNADYGAMLTACKNAGMPWSRTPEVSPYAPITALNGIGNTPTINFAQVDTAYAKYAQLGIPISIAASYTPVGLQDTGGTSYPPKDSNGSMSASAVDAYARWFSAVYNRIKNVLGCTIHSLQLWNEMDGYSQGFTTTQAADLWQAVQARMAADHPTAPIMCGSDGSGVDLYDSSSAAGYGVAIINRAIANGIVLPAAHLHGYPSNLPDWDARFESMDSKMTALGLSSATKIRNTEWGFSLGYSQQEEFSNTHQLPPYDQVEAHLFAAAFITATFERMLAFSRVDAAAYQSLSSGINNGMGLFNYSLSTARTDPRANPAFEAMKMFWKHSGNVIPVAANWPGLHGFGSVNAGVVNVTLGRYRRPRFPGRLGAPGAPRDRELFDLEIAGLPATYTWKMWRLDGTTKGVSGLPLIASGDQTNLPATAELTTMGVSHLQITPGS